RVRSRVQFSPAAPSKNQGNQRFFQRLGRIVTRSRCRLMSRERTANIARCDGDIAGTAASFFFGAALLALGGCTSGVPAQPRESHRDYDFAGWNVACRYDETLS